MLIYPNVLVFLLELKFRTVMPEPTKSALAPKKDFRGYQCAGQQGVPPAQPQGELLTCTRC